MIQETVEKIVIPSNPNKRKARPCGLAFLRFRVSMQDYISLSFLYPS